MRFQNIGTKPVRHIKFRLKIWAKEDNQMIYSQVHTVDIKLEPQDILSSEQFDLKEKLCGMRMANFNKFYAWNVEIIKAW